jgi:hypothetical protein
MGFLIQILLINTNSINPQSSTEVSHDFALENVMDTLCDIQDASVHERLAGFLLGTQYEIATYFCERSSRDTWMHLQLMIFDACGRGPISSTGM